MQAIQNDNTIDTTPMIAINRTNKSCFEICIWYAQEFTYQIEQSISETDRKVMGKL